jgi:membrane protein implicated in regulation of membrane protease activity
MTGAAWQDLTAALATSIALAWLLRRWIHKRRTRSGCDTCAAAAHSRMARRPAPAKAKGGP